jgi:hypothetical protein
LRKKKSLIYQHGSCGERLISGEFTAISFRLLSLG